MNIYRLSISFILFTCIGAAAQSVSLRLSGGGSVAYSPTEIKRIDFSASPTVASLHLTRVDPLTKYFPEDTSFRELTAPEETAANAHAVFQFALHCPKAISDLSISCKQLKDSCGHEISDITTGYVKYVGVSFNLPVKPRDVLTSKSGRFPDPIITGQSCDVPADETQCLWVTVKVPEDAAAGIYRGLVKVTGIVGSETFKAYREIAVKVYPVVMKQPTFGSANWFDLSGGNVAIYNEGTSVKTYSPIYWGYVRALAKWLKECYTNTVRVGGIDVSITNGKYNFDFTHFDRFVEIFREEGVLTNIESYDIGTYTAEKGYGINVPVMQNGSIVHKWMSIDNDTTHTYLEAYFTALKAHLTKKGLWDHYYQHILDEPRATSATDRDAVSYNKIYSYIKSKYPDITIMEASLSAYIKSDIYVPVLSLLAENYNIYKRRKAGGAKLWFYTCMGPQGEYANRFIELPLLKVRILDWIAYKYGASGFLHWGFNWWTEDPFADASNPEGKFPAGDAFIIYPYNRRLYGSIRLEAVRDGIEDYTLLTMLGSKNAYLASQLCGKIVKGWTNYNTDADNFRSVRHDMLEALSK